ncbi:hypothetical protein FisN_21Lh097 [Fistulifera solaris]|uniref:Uncharacterized protein n=1 Tax=Fistulifera solaris TaxID=1519565 RepID=A0A1Z5KK97_FISSO|nr:hypothetical protein FisN_21Lh097 [Fistulifera solaris]|eukprot:GAX26627.1 hypothetical protein FisN_21Lh097 [Fistulifera solaris]
MTLIKILKTTLLLLTLFNKLVIAREERNRALEHTHVIPQDARYCVDTSSTSYTCSDDPMDVRKHFDPDTYKEMDTGLPQRVDGTELERRGIQKVLNAMDAYYYGEVLSNPEYREVRQYWYVCDYEENLKL